MVGAPQGGRVGAAVQPQAAPNINQTAATGINTAMGGAAREIGYQPMQVQAGQLAGTNLQPYMNPYQQNVIDTTMGDLERQRLQQQNVIGAQAGAAGAFGGSRHGLVEAQTNEMAQRNMGNIAANLRQSGFQQAQGAAQQDIASQMQAQLANQQAGLSGSGQRLAASGQLGSLANLGFGMGQQVQQGLQQTGLQQQALQQALIDASKGQFAGYTGAPAQTISYLSQALGAAPAQGTTTRTRQPGLFDYLTMGTSLGGAYLGR